MSSIDTARKAKQEQFVDHIKELRELTKTMSSEPTLAAADGLVIKAKQVREAAHWLVNNHRDK